MIVANILMVSLLAVHLLDIVYPNNQKLHSPELEEAKKRYGRSANANYKNVTDVKQKIFKRHRGTPNNSTLIQESDKFK